MLSRACGRNHHQSHFGAGEIEKHDEKAISDKTTTEKAESENVVAKSVSAQQVLTEKVVVEKAVEKKVSITKSTVANVAIESLRRRIPQPRRSLLRSRWIFLSCRRASELRKRIQTLATLQSTDTLIKLFQD